MDKEGFNGERDWRVTHVAIILVASILGLFALAAIL